MTLSPSLESPASPVKSDLILRATGLRRIFRMGDSSVEVLKGVDMAIRRGEFIAIEGRSGSGKSTLLHILGALDAPDAGFVEFEGQNYDNLGRSRLRNMQFGFVFQFYHLLPELNVLENTLLAPMIDRSWLGFHSEKKELHARANDVLASLGMSHRLKHKPSQLSGGERQRVAIARALMNSPRVLFADEPTGNLDSETGLQIMSVLEKLHRDHGQTVVMVTHDRALARTADRVLVLKEGRLQKVEDSPEPKSP
jgi:lipoprotein-releasing system ATP-binding protein